MPKKSRDLLDIVNTYARVRSAEAQADRARTARAQLELSKQDKQARTIARKKELAARERERQFIRNDKEEEKSEKLRVAQIKSEFAKYISGMFINCECGDAHPFSYTACPRCERPQYLDDLTIRAIFQNLESACIIVETEDLIADMLLNSAPAQFKAYLTRRRRYLEETAEKENENRNQTRIKLQVECDEIVSEIETALTHTHSQLKPLSDKWVSYTVWNDARALIKEKENKIAILQSDRADHLNQMQVYIGKRKEYNNLFYGCGVWGVFALVTGLVAEPNQSNQFKYFVIHYALIPLAIISFLVMLLLKKPQKQLEWQEPKENEEFLRNAISELKKIEVQEPDGLKSDLINKETIKIINFLRKHNYKDPLDDGILTCEEASDIVTTLECAITNARLEYDSNINSIENATSDEFVDNWQDHFITTSLSERISSEPDHTSSQTKPKRKGTH